MKLKIVLPVLGLFLVGLMSSCSNQLDTSMASKTSSKEKSYSYSTVENQVASNQSSLTAVNIGIGGYFAVFY